MTYNPKINCYQCGKISYSFVPVPGASDAFLCSSCCYRNGKALGIKTPDPDLIIDFVTDTVRFKASARRPPRVT